ncbi:hypothetical protein Droror1_Dr00008729 [Drosera rotundifolia]
MFPLKKSRCSRYLSALFKRKGRLRKLVRKSMGNRSHERSDAEDELPADKRSCSSLDSRPTSSSSSPRALSNPSSSNMGTTSSTSSPPPQSSTSQRNSTSSSSTSTPHSNSTGETAEGAGTDSRSEDDSYYESDDLEEDDPRYSSLRRAQEIRSHEDQGKFGVIITRLIDEADCSGQLVALTELCELLSFSTEGSISNALSDQLAPLLAKLARQEAYPDVMLMAFRSITYLCDASPRASAFLVRNDIVPALCERLIAIEYLDVAEQCLQALEKISRDQPLACLASGAILAALGYIDFFSTSVQRTAVSAVVNICRKLPSEPPAMFMEAVPRLCELLQYEDRQLVEKAATCLMKIVERVKNSPDMMSVLCAQGVVNQVTHLLNINGRINLSKPIYTGLIVLLTTFASGSADAVRILFELNIGRILRDTLSSSDLVNGLPSHTVDNCNQVREILKLLNVILPPVSGDHVDELIANKERILVDQPAFLHKFGTNVFPALIEIINSGANVPTCYGCLCTINRVIHFSKPDQLYDMIKDANITSFLIGMFRKKDLHILVKALQVTEALLQKLSDILMCSFAKEGVLFAINSLIDANQASSMSDPKTFGVEASKCLCYTYSDNSVASSESEVCTLEKDYIDTIAKHISMTYFPTEQQGSDGSVSDALRNLRNVSSELVNLANTSTSYDTCIQHEEKFSDMLLHVMGQLSSEESISLFELMEGGLINALLTYFLAGGVSADLCSFHKRLEIFARILLSSSDEAAAELPLLLLVQKLQGALSTVETFPVLGSNVSKLRDSYVSVPHKQQTAYPSLKVLFKKAKEEEELSDYSRGLVAVDPFSSVEAIEQYLWPKVKGKMVAETKSEVPDQENMKKEKDGTPDCVSMDIDLREISSDKVAASNEEDVGKPPLSAGTNGTDEMDIEKSESGAASDIEDDTHKLAFYLEDEELDHSATLYQEILRRRAISRENVGDDVKYWCKAYSLTYKRPRQTRLSSNIERSYSMEPDNILSSQQYMPYFSSLFVGKLVSDLDLTSSTNDTLLLLKSLELINEFSYHLMSHERVTAFAEGKISSLDDIKVSAHTMSQNEFVNNKLTEKLVQQLRDPLSVCIGALPLWCTQLMSSCPFLFSFEARCKFFQLVAFGRPQNQAESSSQGDSEVPRERRVSGGRQSKQKFLVDRLNVLDSATKIMETYENHKVALEVEYIGEVGTGLGPTIEFFTLVSRAIQDTDLGMWRESSGLGLFPRPWSLTSDGAKFGDLVNKFVLLGQLVAKALQDGRVLDIPLSRSFYSLVLGKELGLYDVKSVDSALGKSLLEFQAIAERRRRLKSSGAEDADLEIESAFRSTRIEDLCLDFSLPGYPDYILAHGEDHELVSIDNLEEYVSLVLDATLCAGISRQVEAFKSGFNQANELFDNIKFDHGYTASSPPVIDLLEIMQEFNHVQQRSFVHFVTGAPRLPPGGLAALNPKLTVVRKPLSNNSFDLDLPSVMTCANYLKLPPYPTKEIMRQKILYAIMEGQGSFHLS